MRDSNDTLPPLKDEDAAHGVASAWRSTLQEIVKAFARGDYALAAGVPMVMPVAESIAQQVRRYVADYGETLVELPDATWDTSVAQWTGTHWEVLVDLWTAESGASDLVLSARVFEDGDGYRVEIESVHVP